MAKLQSKLTTTLKFGLELLLPLCAFISTFCWIFFFPAAPKPVRGTFIWLLPILLSFVFAIIYLIVYTCASCSETRPKSQASIFKYSKLSSIRLNVAQSVVGGATLFMLFTMLFWRMVKRLVDNLDPMTREDGTRNDRELVRWFGVGFILIVLLCFWILLCMVWTPAFTSADWLMEEKKKIEAKKEKMGEEDEEGLIEKD